MELHHLAAASRALRAWLDLDRGPAAAAIGISERTLLELEKGRACSDATWSAVEAFYAGQGVELSFGDPLYIAVRTTA